MSQPSSESRRWTRVSNPVAPTVVTFPGGNSAAANPFVRLTNPVAPTVHAFPPIPLLLITIKRHTDSNATALPLFAAHIIREVSRLDELRGGRGMQFDADGSREEPDRIVLRLVPKLIDASATTRLTQFAGELNHLIRIGKSRASSELDHSVLSQINRALQPAMLHDMDVEVAIGA